MTTQERELIKELCAKLDRQHKQNTEIQIRLKALSNTFLRVMDKVLGVIEDDQGSYTD